MVDENNPQVSEDEDVEYVDTMVVEYVDNRRRRTLLAIILLILVLLLVGLGWYLTVLTKPYDQPNSGSLPPGLNWVRSIYGWGKTPNTLLNAPQNTAIGPNGTIWSTTNGTMLVGFNPDGSAAHVVSPPFGPGLKHVLKVAGVAVAPNGEVYVADYGRHVVEVYNSNGQLVREWPTENPPTGIAVRNGRVAVTDFKSITIYDPTGHKIVSWGSRGSGPDQVDLPQGVVIGSDNTVYVSDTQNARVTAFSPNGRVLWSIGGRTPGLMASNSPTDTQHPFALPSGITIDGQGHLAVVDPFQFKVFFLDPAQKGKVIASYGDFGQQDGWFAYPSGISYDPTRDWFAIADTANNRLQIIRFPNTGSNGLLSAASRLTVGPVWICAIPLILLLLAAVAFFLSRRRKSEEEAQPPAPTSGDASVNDVAENAAELPGEEAGASSAGVSDDE